jgi:Lon-like protease
MSSPHGVDDPTADRDGPEADTTTRAGGPRPGRLLRAGFYAGSLAVLLWAAWLVPLPYTEFVPGAPTSIPPLIDVSGVETTEIEGDTALLTVLLQPTTASTALGALLDGDRELRPNQEVVPPDVDRDQFLEQERARFQRQFDVAAAVGAEAAGVDVTIGTVALIAGVLPEGPSDGTLRAGDVVVEIDGDAISTAEELQQRIREQEVGDTVTVLVDRQGDRVEVQVTLGTAGDTDDAALGVLVESAADDLELPFDLTLAETRIGGPSAGLMIALTVYDLLADEDLIAGRTIHGTGSRDADGQVGPVGGVPEKMRAAAAHDADLVLVPASLLEDALGAAPDDLHVVGVETFDEALEALRETR